MKYYLQVQCKSLAYEEKYRNSSMVEIENRFAKFRRNFESVSSWKNILLEIDLKLSNRKENF